MQALLISDNDAYHDSFGFPPIGSVGNIVCGPDYDGDYEIIFSNYPCETLGDPAWFVHKSMIVFVGDTREKASQELDECLTP